MLVELAAANAAFQVIKSAVSNGKDIYSCGKSLTDWFSASSAISLKQSSKYSGGSAYEAWEAQETVREQREELKFMLNKRRLQGWVDFVAFEAEWHRDRREAEKLTLKRRAIRKRVMIKNLNMAITVGLIFLAMMGVLFGVVVYVQENPSNLSTYKITRGK